MSLHGQIKEDQCQKLWLQGTLKSIIFNSVHESRKIMKSWYIK